MPLNAIYTTVGHMECGGGLKSKIRFSLAKFSLILKKLTYTGVFAQFSSTIISSGI
jgi:hypothetical protein